MEASYLTAHVYKGQNRVIYPADPGRICQGLYR